MWHLALNEYWESKKGLWSHLFQNKRLKGAKELCFVIFIFEVYFPTNFDKKKILCVSYYIGFPVPFNKCIYQLLNEY